MKIRLLVNRVDFLYELSSVTSETIIPIDYVYRIVIVFSRKTYQDNLELLIETFVLKRNQRFVLQRFVSIQSISVHQKYLQRRKFNIVHEIC